MHILIYKNRISFTFTHASYIYHTYASTYICMHACQKESWITPPPPLPSPKLMVKLLSHKSNISKNQAQMGLFVIITGRKNSIKIVVSSSFFFLLKKKSHTQTYSAIHRYHHHTAWEAIILTFAALCAVWKKHICYIIYLLESVHISQITIFFWLYQMLIYKDGASAYI